MEAGGASKYATPRGDFLSSSTCQNQVLGIYLAPNQALLAKSIMEITSKPFFFPRLSMMLMSFKKGVSSSKEMA